MHSSIKKVRFPTTKMRAQRWAWIYAIWLISDPLGVYKLRTRKRTTCTTNKNISRIDTIMMFALLILTIALYFFRTTLQFHWRRLDCRWWKMSGPWKTASANRTCPSRTAKGLADAKAPLPSARRSIPRQRPLRQLHLTALSNFSSRVGFVLRQVQKIS